MYKDILQGAVVRNVNSAIHRTMIFSNFLNLLVTGKTLIEDKLQLQLHLRMCGFCLHFCFNQL